MSQDLNVCSFTGRLVKDAELKTVGQKETKCLEFSIANNTGFGQYATTSYIDVQLWGAGAAGVEPYMKKGQQIAVSGTLKQDRWVDSQGVKHTNWRLSAMSVVLLGSAKRTDDAEASLAYRELMSNAPTADTVF